MADISRTSYNHDEDYGTYGSPDPVPAGEYKCMMVESEMRETRSGSGEYLRCVFEIVEGDYKGRKLFSNLNLVNENAVAVRIANAELKAICAACGGLRPQNSEELHNIPLILRVIQKKREDTGDMQNEVKGYKSVADQGGGGGGGGASQKPAPVGPSTGRKAPWKKQ